VTQPQTAVQKDNRNSLSHAHVVKVFSVDGNEPRCLGARGE
jgi:hypothetical protein